MFERIKEHNRYIQLARTQSSDVSEHRSAVGHYPLWDEVKLKVRDAHWYTGSVKEAIHTRFHSDNINRGSGMEIPEAWMPTIKLRDTHSVALRTTEGIISSLNGKDRNPRINNSPSEDRNAPIIAKDGAPYIDT